MADDIQHCHGCIQRARALSILFSESGKILGREFAVNESWSMGEDHDHDRQSCTGGFYLAQNVAWTAVGPANRGTHGHQYILQNTVMLEFSLLTCIFKNRLRISSGRSGDPSNMPARPKRIDSNMFYGLKLFWVHHAE